MAVKLAKTAAVTYTQTSINTTSTHLYEVKTTGDYEWMLTRVEAANAGEANQNAINEHYRQYGVGPVTVNSTTLIK